MQSANGKTYDEIWKMFSAEHGDNATAWKAHCKWKEIGKALSKPGGK